MRHGAWDLLYLLIGLIVVLVLVQLIFKVI